MSARRTGPERRVDPAATAARRRRTRLLWWTSPLYVGLLVAGCQVTTMPAQVSAAMAAVERGDPAAAVSAFEGLDGADLGIEAWRAEFDLGTAALLDDDLYTAWDALTRALDHVPEAHRCEVQINLALTLEAWGDDEMRWAADYADWAELAQSYVDAGTPYPDDVPWGDDSTPAELVDTSRGWAATAQQDYQAAGQARQDPACAGGGASDTPPDPDANQRLDRKEQKAGQDANPDEPQEPTADQAEADRQAELAERQAEADAQAEEQRQQEASGGDPASGSTSDPEGDGSGGGTGSNY